MPLTVSRQSSAPSAPLNFTTVKLVPGPGAPVTPAATTPPSSSTATALAASGAEALRLMAWRHSSAPLAPSSLTTAKLFVWGLLVALPAATTFAPSIASALATPQHALAMPQHGMECTHNSPPLDPSSVATTKFPPLFATAAATTFPAPSTATALPCPTGLRPPETSSSHSCAPLAPSYFLTMKSGNPPARTPAASTFPAPSIATARATEV